MSKEDKSIVHREDVKEQLSRLGMDVFFSDEEVKKDSKGRVIDTNPIKQRAKKVVKSTKPKKVTKTSRVPQRQRVQKSASPTGAKFMSFVENILN